MSSLKLVDMVKETKEEKKIEKQKQEIKKLKSQVREARYLFRKQLKFFGNETRKQIVTLITSALGFVAALLWRDAVQAFLIQTFQIAPGQGGAWIAQASVALIVTIFIVIATISITRLMKVQS